MGKRLSLICFILLLISTMAEIIIAAENDDTALSTSTGLNSGSVIEQQETEIEIPSKSVTNISEPNNGSSVKMIVGGDSKGGVAKQVTVPVKE